MEARPTNGIAVVEPGTITELPRRGPRLGLPTPEEINSLMAYGSIIVKSGMAPAHIKTPEAAIVVMRYGHQLGIDEFTALQNMYVINGKPTGMASLLHSLILRDHGGDAVQILKMDATACILSCKRRDSSHRTEISYTWDEADRAGLTKKNPVWNQYPADMLFARCISRAGRAVFRDSTMGMYTPEELGGEVIEVSGEVVNVARGEVARDERPAAPKFANLHRAGKERDLDHDALSRVVRFKFPAIHSMSQLTDAMSNDLASLIEEAAEDDLIAWSMDWLAEISAAEARGMDVLTEMGLSIKAAGITKKDHPEIAAAYQTAMNRLKAAGASAAPAPSIEQETIDAEFALLMDMPDGDAGNDKYTA